MSAEKKEEEKEKEKLKLAQWASLKSCGRIVNTVRTRDYRLECIVGGCENGRFWEQIITT